MNQNIQQRLLQLLSSDMETVNGTAFEYLCAEVFNLLVGKKNIKRLAYLQCDIFYEYGLQVVL